MKKFIQHALVILVSFAVTKASAQGTLVSIVPNSAQNGSTVDMIIKGAGTHFNANCQITIDGLPVQVIGNINVPDPETMLFKCIIPQNLTPGEHPLNVITNGVQSPSFFFKVFEKGNELNVVVNVMPIQSITINDLDPQNIGNSPILFTVSILNDATNRQNLKAVLTLSGDIYGKIGEATKKEINIAPNMNFTFTNKEFTSYDVASNGSFFEKAVKTGTLPSDVYTYQIDIYNELGVKIGSGIGKNTIMNQLSKPELISPGNEFSRQPEALRVKQPLFQWFSQGNEFEFALYEVNAGQKTGEEVVLNRPVFKTVIKATSLQYPASAEMLEEGKTYAWQVKMLNVGTSGNNALASDVFWFKYTASGALQTIVSSIKLTPDDGFVQVGQSLQILASAFTADNSPIKDPVIEWKVIPAEAGSVDQKGLFTAGPKAGSCAIVAKNGDIQEYATINIITINSNDASIKIMMQKLFGIPTK